MMKLVNGVEQRLTLGCYVDDLFTLYTHDGPHSLYAKFVGALTRHWNVEDEGPVSDLLNVDISVDDIHVMLKQERYIAHLVATYLPDGVPLSLQKSRSRTIDAGLFASCQSLVGALFYCSTQTRPDVAFAVGMLRRAMSCPTDKLLAAAQRVLMYLTVAISNDKSN
eukprot:983468-Pleurochrysis_carterae.AAC.2